MCRSVPQIEVALTRTRTSVGPLAGTPAASSDSPRPACILRKAFMVPAISYAAPSGTQPSDANTRILRPGTEQLLRTGRSVSPGLNVAEIDGFAQGGERIARGDEFVSDEALIAGGHDAAHHPVP